MNPRTYFRRSILLAGLAALVLPSWSAAEELADYVLVVKSERTLYLLRDDEIIDSFRVTFGTNPKGHKQREGDGRTPEGIYILDWKHSASDFHKSIHVSYPDENDKKKAAEDGSSPGGAIMVHGQKNGYAWLSPLARYVNWTDGCIALSNSDMDIVWAKVQSEIPIEIRP
jgi:murein L,D-transpeptidase YafK